MRPWHLRAWSGMNFTAWVGALARNRFAVSPSRVPMALIIAGIGLLNSCLAKLQSLIYG